MRSVIGLLLAALALQAAPYSYRRTVTVAGSVPSTQASFPVLLQGTFAYLATVANGGLIQNTTTLNGQLVPADLAFTSDSACNSLLPWEVSNYTATSGLIGVWIQLPSMANGTVFYMCYSAAAVTTYQATAAGTWDSNTRAVFHLSNGTTLSSIDSTSNANSGTATLVSAGAGQVDGGGAFNAATTNIDFGAGSSIASLFATGGTIEAWIRPTTFGGGSNGRILNKSDNTTPSNGWLFQVLTSGSVKFGVGFTGAVGGWNTPAASTPVATWSHVAVTYSAASAANVPIMYVNGVAATLTTVGTPTGTVGADATLHGLIGNGPGLTRNFDGIIDEVRLYSTIRSADYIKTEYNNQTDANFLTIGAAAPMRRQDTLIIW